MKKLKYLLVLVLFCSPILFAGCSSATGLNNVEYNVKYYKFSSKMIYSDEIENDYIAYIVFHDNHSGEYREYVEGYSSKCFRVLFNYTKIDDSSVALTFKKQDIVYDSSNIATDTGMGSFILVVSENVLIQTTTSYMNYYYSEKYLKEQGYIVDRE